jgi:hypothetical protein
MKKERKHFTPEEKVAILTRHLLEKVPVSELCEELGLRPTVFYRWQKELTHSERQDRTLAQIAEKRVHSAGNAAVAGRCTAPGRGLCGALQQRSPEQCHRLHHSKGHARRASAGDSSRAGSQVGRGEGTAEESPPGAA